MTFTTGHALVIGVGSYPKLSRRWQAPSTARDAETLAAALTDVQTAGYPATQITLLHDEKATKVQVLHALDTLAEKLTEQDTFLFFYSGHGHYDRSKTYYLTTSDTDVDLVGMHEMVRTGTGISQTELLDKLRAIKAKKVLLIFNACHAGELMQTLGPDEEPILGTNIPEETSKALLGTGEGRVLISACRADQVSFVGPDNTTLFTQALIEGLQGVGVTSRGGYISNFDLYSYVFDAVIDSVQTKIREQVRAQYRGKQEPTLTIIQQVGPFPVALYKGQETTLGAFNAPAEPPMETAITQVSRAEARSLFRQLVVVGRDMNRAGGDIVYGDKVSGDKVNGDKITVGDITGSGIAIGRNARATVSTVSLNNELTSRFADIYRQITASDKHSIVKETVAQQVKAIETEVVKGEQAEADKIEGRLQIIAGMMPDILEVTVNTLLSPISGIAIGVKKVAARAKAAIGRN